jgi:hypothetical protein
VTPPPTPPSSAKLVADKLMNPRGFTFGPDGAIYVAETGTKAEDGVTVTPPAGPVKAGCEAWRPSFDRIQAHCPGVVAPKNGTNGRITRIARDGTRTTVADHLPVVDGPFQATMGVTIMTIPPYAPGAAKVFKITSDGKSPNGPPQVVAAPLMYPGALCWGPDGLYSTFNTIGTVQGGPAIGAIYKIDTGR